MIIKKRDGQIEEANFAKVQERVKSQASGLDIKLDEIAKKAIERMYPGISTTEIDKHLASIAVNFDVHPDYNTLAGRLAVSSLHKSTTIGHLSAKEMRSIRRMLTSGDGFDRDHDIFGKFRGQIKGDKRREELLEALLEKYEQKIRAKSTIDKRKEEVAYLLKENRFFNAMKILSKQKLVTRKIFNLAEKYQTKIEDAIDYNRDFSHDYFGFTTLEKRYLLKSYDSDRNMSVIEERPQDMFMRVALGICGDEIDDAIELYHLMSQGYYTHATPTLFNSGTPKPQMSSCFLLQNKEDSIDGLFKTYHEAAMISKHSGGMGVHYSNVRAKNSHIKGNNGISKGVVPFLKVMHQTACAVNQGGKRAGAVAVYMEPWHADIQDFIVLRKQDGIEEERARDLFLALWVPDLFFERAIAKEKWTLFSPDSAPGLQDVYGDEFKELYEKYEKEGKGLAEIDAGELWEDIFSVMIETGMPYICAKDHANRKSNQKNVGTIKSSNLCTEIMEVSSSEETAVCNLASHCLPKYVKKRRDGTSYFDHEEFHANVKVSTKNLDRVIDVNFYVNDLCKNSNMRHRPVGLGVQGLANVFHKMRVPYNSPEAKEINKEIFETMYHAALEASMEIATKSGKYPSFNDNGGCPAAHGILQFDMWDVTPSDRYDWGKLKKAIAKNGLRNSLLVAPMPTASTSQIFGNTESFEPLTENIFKRTTNAGEFLVVNRHMVEHLEELGVWGEDVLDHLKRNHGSLQGYNLLPKEVRDIYKTVWEISRKDQIDMARDRGAFICQSQSFNMHIDNPSIKTIHQVIFYGWRQGLKTLSYYTRTNPAATNQQVTVSRTAKETSGQVTVVTEDPEDCEACGS